MPGGDLLDGADQVGGEVRAEWGGMSAAFGRLLAVFDFALPAQEARRVDEVVAVCELIDRYIDNEPSIPQRRAAIARVDRALGGARGRVPIELEAALARFAASFEEPEEARRTLARICAAGARAQEAQSRAAFVREVRDEGREFSALFVPLIAPHTDARFITFFLDLGEVANLADKLVDARRDARAGELSLRPGVRHHARLSAEIVRDGLDLVRRAPARRDFVRWAVSFLRPS